MKNSGNRTWVEISIDSIIHNYRQFRQITNCECNSNTNSITNSNTDGNSNIKRVKIMGVVKANGYGHGSVTLSKALCEDGIDYLGVASLDEAIELRNAGIAVPILVLNYIDPRRSFELIKYDIEQTVYSFELAQEISNCASLCNKRINIHIKIDTGMTRVGFDFREAIEGVQKIAQLPGVFVQGLFTHFSSADEVSPSYTEMQFERFMEVVEKLRHLGIEIPLKHVCNSAGAIQYKHMHLDMVRPGISLYGCYPSKEVDRSLIDLKPGMTFKSSVIRINEVDDGVSVSYGRIFTTQRKSRIATIPVGYADGFSRLLTNKARVLINGQFVSVVGKICMDQCMIDITDVEGDVKIGDEVVLFGSQKDKIILADELADSIGTINYEIVCMVARRVPRHFIKDSEEVSVENYLREEVLE